MEKEVKMKKPILLFIIIILFISLIFNGFLSYVYLVLPWNIKCLEKNIQLQLKKQKCDSLLKLSDRYPI